MQLDIRVLELLASKICHDLVSPVGAINNGVELIEEIGGDVGEDAIKLISDSAQHASRRLRMMRLVYGRAGAEEALTFKEVSEILRDHFSVTKVSFTMPATFSEHKVLDHKGAKKVLLSLVLLAEESLAYGGSVVVQDNGGHSIDIKATGRNASVSVPAQDALFGSAKVDDLVPRTVHAYIAGKFAEYYGVKISLNDAEQGEAIILSLSV